MTQKQAERFHEFEAMFSNAQTAPHVIEQLCAAIAEPDMSSWVCIEGTNEIGSLVWLVDECGRVVTTATGVPKDIEAEDAS